MYRYTIVDICKLDDNLIKIVGDNNKKWNYDSDKDITGLLNINFLSKSGDFSIAITRFLDNFFDNKNKKYILKQTNVNEIVSIYDYDNNQKITELNVYISDVDLNETIVICSNIEELKSFLLDDNVSKTLPFNKNFLENISNILLKGDNPEIDANVSKMIPFNKSFLENISNILKQKTNENVYIEIVDCKNYETRVKGECIYFVVINKILNNKTYYYFTPSLSPIILSHKQRSELMKYKK